MEENVRFLDMGGLDDGAVRQLQALLHPSNLGSEIEFPWSSNYSNEDVYSKAHLSSLNVHAPAFEAYVSACQSRASGAVEARQQNPLSYSNSTNLQNVQLITDPHYYTAGHIRTVHQSYANGQPMLPNVFDQNITYSQPPKPFNGDFYSQTATKPVKVSSFKLNPTVSSFVPSNIESFRQPEPFSNGQQKHVQGFSADVYGNNCTNNQNYELEDSGLNEGYSVVGNEEGMAKVVRQVAVMDFNVVDATENVENDHKVQVNEGIMLQNIKSEGRKVSDEIVHEDSSTHIVPEEATNITAHQELELEKDNCMPAEKDNASNISVVKSSADVQETQPVAIPVRRSWADIVSKGQKPTEKVSLLIPAGEGEKSVKISTKDQESEVLLINEDKMSLTLGKHLFYLQLNFNPVLLQARGLINRRNWCYINATLQALLGCPPFYTMLRNLPLGPGVERGKSSTPVIDSMVKVAYEFLQVEKAQEELQVGQPFQPDFIYDMLRDLKSDCLKGQQEDAEEFLSFILNGMHEEMVKIIKNYERKNHLDLESETKENGGISDGEEEWQVIGSKHKGMVTRKVAEHKTPISDLLGGQIKSFLTTNGNKTSASIQPFFTLQLDVQSENVNSVSEALKEMTIKEPIQGYTCAKTKQEVEAFSHIAFQKLPPVLILHLKRFVYNKNGGCKKVMKKTDYPLVLEINRDTFAPDVKKSQRLRQYKLFAVMYHDGEEAIKGHYISDVYNHGSQTWVRCDDRAVTAVTEEQVLSYSPPRVPYLLFYQES